MFPVPSWFFIAAATIALGTIEANAATYTVTQTGNSGAGSLRTAITSANNTFDQDLIVFDLPGAGPHVIDLTSPLPTIVDPVSIINDRSGDEPITIQRNGAGGSFRVFTVASPEVLLAGIAISNGNVAAFAPGTVGSTGGAIRNTGTLTVRNCTFSGNAARSGGAIWTGSALAVMGCTFISNSADTGGAIYHSNTLEVTNSTFSDNSATADGGGIYSFQSFQASAFVRNVTFSGNSAAQGGALYGFISTANTIFRRGSSGENIGGSVTSNGNNLSDDSAGGDGTTGPGGLLNGPGDIRNTDPQLSALADNGGLTLTHALAATSPAINAGNDAYALLTDQRNYTRVGVTDIGAFEFGGMPAPPPSMALTVTNANDSGPGSLRQALFSAAPGATIDFAADVTGAIILTSGQLVIDKAITINGPGASVLAVDGNASSRVLRIGSVFSTVTATISGLTIRGGRAFGLPNSGTARGGGISNIGTLTVQDCIITGNSAVGYDATPTEARGSAVGGGIESNGGLTLVRTVLSNNSAIGGNSGGEATGGGLSQLGDLIITDCQVEGNQAVGKTTGGHARGGGIHHWGFASLAVTSSTISGNTARGGDGEGDGAYGASVEGAGLHANGEELSLINCTVSNNLGIAGKGADGGTQNGSGGGGGKALGGGLFNASSVTTISGCTFSGNSATGGGAGQSTPGEHGGFPEEGAGGAIYRSVFTLDGSTPSTMLVNCTISGNSANGGGVILQTGNAGRGGGISHHLGSLISVNCTLANNTATGEGGSGFFTVPPRGGCLFIGNGPVILRNTIVAGGSAGQGPDVNGPLDGSSSFNLIGDGSNMTGVTHGNNGNQVGSNASPLDPKLGPLADNGGPTLTRALNSDSPARDAGSSGAITNPPFSGPPFFDQRGSGFPRVVNSTVDVGSFEASGAGPAPTPTPTPSPTATPTPSPTPTLTPTPTPTPSPTPGLVGNVATRLPVGAGDNALIQGFIVQGPVGSTKKIMVRALGPFLTRFGITDALPNPTLEIRNGNNIVVATNNDWKTTQIGGIITGDQSGEINSSGLAPSDDLESAIIANLLPGNYTAVVRGVGDTTGTGIVDAYDMSPGSPARLANIATRGFIQPGDKLMIAGFIIQNGSVRAAVRAIGPSLIQFGITNALPDTTLQIRDVNGAILLENDNWKTDPAQKQELENNGLQPGHDLEAALIMTIPPGQYTAQERGKDQDSGIGVVEVYFLQ
ncbi:MAG TPA: choice-of-anchor Q domain-containing protein [Chthoniobacterales bacterium]|nr:choice-of-anchor Q domain-containing protein [Chthoniobacterales bacterium]